MTTPEIVEYNRKEGARLDAWEARQKQGYVYFLRAGNTVKIGFSINLRQRQEKLRNGNSFPVFICKYVKGDRSAERSFHKRFAEYRLRGEWFDLRGSLAKYLERHFRPVDLPGLMNDPKPEIQIIL
jgi:hypothetical protein